MSEVIDVTKLEPSDRVVFGVTVVVEDLENDVETTYRIVGETESDVKAGLISVTSPMGRALVGKEVGDEAVVRTPKGERRFSINDVQYR